MKTMLSEKEQKEQNAFQYFLKMRDLPRNSELFESQKPPAPDILYKPSSGCIEYELFEICAPNIAAAISKTVKSNDGISPIILPHDTYKETFANKLFRKRYETNYPIELLCYTAGRTIAWDDLVIEDLTPIIPEDVQFSRIWFLGDKLHLLYKSKNL